jgi:hypothetical protein
VEQNDKGGVSEKARRQASAERGEHGGVGVWVEESTEWFVARGSFFEVDGREGTVDVVVRGRLRRWWSSEKRWSMLANTEGLQLVSVLVLLCTIRKEERKWGEKDSCRHVQAKGE